MTSKTIFNMDSKTKKAAMSKAKKEGWTLSAFLNFAAREYVDGNLTHTLLEKELEEARKAIRRGEYISQEDLIKKLGLKL